MAIQEIPTHEELILYEILRHPVFNWEFTQNVDKLPHEEEFEFTGYQQEFICDFNSYVSLCCGRAVGKTEAITAILIWAMINNLFPADYLVYSVPNKSQLAPVWARITRLFRSNSILSSYVQSKKGINSSEHTITLLNGGILLCRIAGTKGDGTNVIGLHTPFQVVDEGGYYPWGTYIELEPTLNTWTPGMRKIVSGVPTGFRENNVLYHADFNDPDFTKHRISSLDNPRFSEDDEARARKLYGEPDEEDYIHLVFGRHGSPTFAVFDRGLFDVRQYPVYQLNLNGIQLANNMEEYFERLATLPILDGNKKVIMGVDLGYTDPTAIVIMYLNNNGQFKFHARVQLNKVPYPIQSQVIDYLDSKYKPMLLGVDAGHAGEAEIQKLQMDTRYLHKNYTKRLIPVQFTSNVVLGIDAEGNEVKQKTRPFSITVLQSYSNEHKIIYSSTDMDLVAELERMVYVKTPSGNKVYRTLTPKGGQKGNDHFTSALLCAMMAWWLENESFSPAAESKKLWAGSWL